jgi:hypothetical protein
MHLFAITTSAAPLTLVRPTPIVVSTMASLFAGDFNPRMRPDPLIPQPPRPGSLWFPSFMVLTAFGLLQALHVHPGHSLQFCLPCELRMSRQRGRPRRGSPWHPPRPRVSVSPPGSPSTHSSQPLQPELEPLASSTPPASRFECLVITDSSSGSLSRFPAVPLNSLASGPSFAPVACSSRPPLEAPPFLRNAQHRTHSSTDFIPDSQLQDSLAILYGLVFELRQGLEDLHFRLQLLDGKTSTLLQILSTFQEAFHSTPEAAAATEMPHAEVVDRNEQVQQPEGGDLVQVTHGDTEAATAMGIHAHNPPGVTLPAANLEGGNLDADMQMEGKGTPIEEEPWDAAYQATWPGYLPSV